CWAEGDSGADGIILMEVTFASLRYTVRTDAQNFALTAAGGKGELERFVEREDHCTVQSLPLPAGSVFWTGGPHAGETIPAAASYLLYFSSALRYCWHDVPDVN